MAPSIIAKPDFFTKEWYEEQKFLDKKDIDIAKDLFVSAPILRRFKKEAGVYGGIRKVYTLKFIPPDYFTLEHYTDLKNNKKVTDEEIAEGFDISLTTLHRIKKELGWDINEGKKFRGRRHNVYDYDRIIKLHKSNLSTQKIAKTVGCGKTTVLRAIKMWKEQVKGWNHVS